MYQSSKSSKRRRVLLLLVFSCLAWAVAQTNTASAEVTYLKATSVSGALGDDFQDDHYGVFFCAVAIDSQAVCWGSNREGQLGIGNKQNQRKPVFVRRLGKVREIAVGGAHSCALLLDGHLKCWGSNDTGELGVGDRRDRKFPVAVRGLSNVADVDLDQDSTCALKASGALFCWGANDYRKLGFRPRKGDRRGHDVPVTSKPRRVPHIRAVEKVATGDLHTCAILRSKKVVCWGANYEHQLNRRVPRVASGRPLKVPGLSKAVDIDTGTTFQTCAALVSGKVKCWGGGRLGLNTVPGLNDAQSISVTNLGACALRSEGLVSCWAQSYGGADGETEPVFGLDDAVDVSTAGNTSCAVRESEDVICWGQNSQGALGNGLFGDAKYRPVNVLAPQSEIEFPDLGISPKRCVKAGLQRPKTLWGYNNVFFQSNSRSNRVNAENRFGVIYRFRQIPVKCNLGFVRTARMKVTGVTPGRGRHIIPDISRRKWWILASSNRDGVPDGKSPWGLESYEYGGKLPNIRRTTRVRAFVQIRVFRLQDHKLMGSKKFRVKWRRIKDRWS